jgi:tRNA A37 threonylcarbamoyladenosine synthetase subunit TsaC/SUA5/YrdC
MKLHIFNDVEQTAPSNTHLFPKEAPTQFAVEGEFVEHVFEMVKIFLPKAFHKRNAMEEPVTLVLHDFSRQQSFSAQMQAMQDGRIPSRKLMLALCKALEARFAAVDCRVSIEVGEYYLADDLVKSRKPKKRGKAEKIEKTATKLDQYFENEEQPLLGPTSAAAGGDPAVGLEEPLEKDVDKNFLLYRMLHSLPNDDTHVLVYTHRRAATNMIEFFKKKTQLISHVKTVMFFAYSSSIYFLPQKVNIEPIPVEYSTPLLEGTGAVLNEPVLYPKQASENLVANHLARVSKESGGRLKRMFTSKKKTLEARLKKFSSGQLLSQHIPVKEVIGSAGRYKMGATAHLQGASANAPRVALPKQCIEKLTLPPAVLQIWLHFDTMNIESENIHKTIEGSAFKVDGPMAQYLKDLITKVKPSRVELHNNSRAQNYAGENKVSATRLVSTLQAFEALAHTLKENISDPNIDIVIDPFLLADTCREELKPGDTWSRSLADINKTTPPGFPRRVTENSAYPELLDTHIAQSDFKLDNLYVRMQRPLRAYTHIVAIESDSSIIESYKLLLNAPCEILPQGYGFTLLQYTSLPESKSTDIQMVFQKMGQSAYKARGVWLTNFFTEKRRNAADADERYNDITQADIIAHHSLLKNEPKRDLKQQAWFDTATEALRTFTSKKTYRLGESLPFAATMMMSPLQKEHLKKEVMHELHLWLDFKGCIWPENIEFSPDGTVYFGGPLLLQLIGMIVKFKAATASKPLTVVLSSFSHRQSFVTDNNDSLGSVSISSLQAFEAILSQLKAYFEAFAPGQYTIKLDKYLLADSFINKDAGTTWQQAIDYIYNEATPPFPLDPEQLKKLSDDLILGPDFPSDVNKLALTYCKVQRIPANVKAHVLIYDSSSSIPKSQYDTFIQPYYTGLIPSHISCQFYHYKMGDSNRRVLTTALPCQKTIFGNGFSDPRRAGFIQYAYQDFVTQQGRLKAERVQWEQHQRQQPKNMEQLEELKRQLVQIKADECSAMLTFLEGPLAIKHKGVEWIADLKIQLERKQDLGEQHMLLAKNVFILKSAKCTAMFESLKQQLEKKVVGRNSNEWIASIEKQLEALYDVDDKLKLLGDQLALISVNDGFLASDGTVLGSTHAQAACTKPLASIELKEQKRKLAIEAEILELEQGERRRASQALAQAQELTALTATREVLMRYHLYNGGDKKAERLSDSWLVFTAKDAVSPVLAGSLLRPTKHSTVKYAHSQQLRRERMREVSENGKRKLYLVDKDSRHFSCFKDLSAGVFSLPVPESYDSLPHFGVENLEPILGVPILGVMQKEVEIFHSIQVVHNELAGLYAPLREDRPVNYRFIQLLYQTDFCHGTFFTPLIQFLQSMLNNMHPGAEINKEVDMDIDEGILDVNYLQGNDIKISYQKTIILSGIQPGKTHKLEMFVDFLLKDIPAASLLGKQILNPLSANAGKQCYWEIAELAGGVTTEDKELYAIVQQCGDNYRLG